MPAPWFTGSDLLVSLSEAEQRQQDAADERDAALDAAEFNDPRRQDELQHEADLQFEYSKPEYDD